MMLILRFALIALSLVLAMQLRWPMIDDAFITFRYVEQALFGNGWVFNTGEHVLGVSTPLWMMLLTVFGSLGAPLEMAALSLSASAIILLGLLWERRLRAAGMPGWATLAFVPALLLGADFHIALSSGMETPLYFLFVFGSLIAVAEERDRLAGLLASLATLTRPDGLVLIVAICAAFTFSRPRRILSFASFALLPLIPWLIFSEATYGALLPHTVEAKRVIHAAGPILSAKTLLELVTITSSGLLLTALGVSVLLLGLRSEWRAWRWRTEYLAATLWGALYAGGLIFSGIEPVFFWYSTPLLLGAFLYVSLLLSEQAEQMPLHLRSLIVLAITVLLAGTSSLERRRPEPMLMRQEVYHLIAKDMQPLVQTQDILYFAEIGALSRPFLGNEVIDSAGLVSPDVLALRSKALRLSPTNNPEDASYPWSAEIIQERRPDWIVSPGVWIQLGSLMKESWFNEAYERFGTYSFGRQQSCTIFVFRRRV